MEKQRSFSFKRTRFFVFSFTIAFSLIFLTFFSIWVFKTDPLFINPESRFQFTQVIESSSNSSIRLIINLNQTHFRKLSNSSQSPNISFRFDGFQKKSSGSQLANLDSHKVDDVNGTEFSGFHVNSSVRSANPSGLVDLNHREPESSVSKPENSVLKPENPVSEGLFLKPNVSISANLSGLVDLNHTEPESSVSKPENSVLKPENLVSEGLFLKPNVSISRGIHRIDEEKDERVCDVSRGKWVFDESYPLYTTLTCPFIDEAFNCEANGRLDKDYMKWRWRPQDCDIPRFNATNMLELIRGKRLVFVGDSINRNQWESMLCLLMSAIKDPKRVFEVHGRRITKDKGNYCFKFLDYKCTVEYYVSHFLVHEGKARVGKKRTQTLRIDTVDRGSSRWKGADVLVFNTAHWWSHYKTKSGVNYYQEGDTVLPRLHVSTAFRKSMTTWASWVDKYINPRKTHVIFRSSAPSHFRGGEWNAGGHCKESTQPLNQTATTNYPTNNVIIEEVLRQMKTPVKFLNVTSLSDYRTDGHPSVYGRKRGSGLRGEDCSHWCLPGVPDTWNQLLYLHLHSGVSHKYVQ